VTSWGPNVSNCDPAPEPDGDPCDERALSPEAPSIGTGIWAKSHIATSVGGVVNMQFFHVSLRLTPRNQAYFVRKYPQYFSHPDPWNNYFATIGAGPSSSADMDMSHCFGDLRLHSDIDRPADVDLPPQPMFERLNYPQELEDQLIETLLHLAVSGYGGYADDLWYFCVPESGDGYNSNSFTAGLLNAAGIPLPNYPGGHLAVFPGWSKPVPTQYFHR
jgi:hypothetical protein